MAANTGQPSARLTGAHACTGISGFTCETLSVPLDHAGGTRRVLHLQVGAENVSSARRGVLVFLTGGPGQPGVPLIPRVRSRLGAALGGYRLVMFDQRGTGAGALRCPALQAAAGASDLTVVPPKADASCARAIGSDRRYFSTTETVADIEALRRALNAPRLTLDGVSYGTFVAERYALTYPTRVTRLVLDSVVPQDGIDPLDLASIERTTPALRDACAAVRCGYDPAADLSAVVRAYHDGPELLDALVGDSVVTPDFRRALAALHAGAAGDMRGIESLLRSASAGESATADVLSQGLHQSTLCLDIQAPWDPDAPSAQRARLIAGEAAALPDRATFPYDRATAVGNGIGAGCARWPATSPPSLADGDATRPLPPVPVLLLAGDRDLSTPLPWAREEASDATDGQLLVVPRSGHSVQTRSNDPTMRRTLKRFLAG
ncbi:MAG TPA: alpha/beta fold hydrolase [Solirubrobacteraceae bacterium]|jgi:pimeloyl-ACP methyl ester carboxylesterase